MSLDVLATHTEPVVLVLPPAVSMIRVGRLTASSIASLADMSVDDIDDVKIAVSEIITLLVQFGGGMAVTLRFETSEEAFTVTGTTAADALDPFEQDVSITEAVLAAVCDRHEITCIDGVMTAKVVKRLGTSGDDRA